MIKDWSLISAFLEFPPSHNMSLLDESLLLSFLYTNTIAIYLWLTSLDVRTFGFDRRLSLNFQPTTSAVVFSVLKLIISVTVVCNVRMYVNPFMNVLCVCVFVNFFLSFIANYLCQKLLFTIHFDTWLYR